MLLVCYSLLNSQNITITVKNKGSGSVTRTPLTLPPQCLSVFSPNAGKYGPEKLRIQTLTYRPHTYRPGTVSTLSPFLLGGQSSIPNFEKGGIRKNMSAWGVLQCPCHSYLPGMFLAKKRLSKMKFSNGLNFQMSVVVCFSQTTK